MEGEWPKLSLREANVTLIDCDHRTPPASQAGYPYVAIPQLRNGRIDLSDVRRITPENFVEWTRKAKPLPNDVVLSRRCNPGETAFVSPGLEFALGQNLVLLRADGTMVYPPFLRWLVRGPEWWEQIGKFLNVGAIFDSLKCADVPNFELRIPLLPEQRAIAHILGTLDDKIELNRRMNETLEAMAWALFKSWFVDFDPVRAKAESRDPGLPQPLADLFPARLVDSELGEIPKGWEVSLAGDLFDVAIGKTPPRKEHQWFSTDPHNIRWMSIKDLGQAGVFISEVSEYLTANAVERFRVRRIPDGTVVLSFKLTVGRVAITDGEMLSNEAIAHFVPRGMTFLSAAYLYYYLRQFDYKSLGSTSSIATAVNSDSVRAIPVLVPSAELHQAFLSTALPYFFRLRALQRESRTLAALRDALLPKLISGELRIEDAEGFIESTNAVAADFSHLRGIESCQSS